MSQPLRIGTRGSELALQQAETAKDILNRAGIEATIRVIRTQGDHDQQSSLAAMSGSGFFTKALEDALLAGSIDLAVHSHKDLETRGHPDLIIATATARAPRNDRLIIRPEAHDPTLSLQLNPNAIVGTDSPRRRAQLNAFRPDLRMESMRGNVHTRLEKLSSGRYDAIVLARAGLDRLNVPLDGFHYLDLDCREFIPAPAQGVLALQTHKADRATNALLEGTADPDVSECAAAERKILELLRGGCQMPMGAYAEKEKGTYHIWTTMAPEESAFPKRLKLEGKDPDALAEEAVKKLRSTPRRSIFISRDPSDDDLFQRAMEAQGHPLSARSLIRTEPLPLEEVPKAECCVFTSKNAVRHFFSAVEPSAMDIQHFGAIGATTAQALKEHGIVPAIEGRDADLEHVARTLQKELEPGAKVLFPGARHSKRTIQRVLEPDHTVIELPVYETLHQKRDSIPESDLYLFTSPSNVRSFFDTNKETLPDNAKLIAIGRTTREALAPYTDKPVHIPWTPAPWGLIDLVNGI